MAHARKADSPLRRVPQQPRGRRTVQRILHATRRLLEREGPAALNTNRIAEDVGIGIGSLYGYFPNKQAIVLELMAAVADEEAELVLARIHATQRQSLAGMIAATVQATFELYRKNHALYQALWALAGSGRAVGHRPGEQLIQQAVRARLAQHAEEITVADLDRAAFTCFHLVESLALQMAASGTQRWGEADCVQEIVTVVLRYLGLR